MEPDLGIVEIGELFAHEREIDVALDAPYAMHFTTTSARAHFEIEEVCAKEVCAHARLRPMWDIEMPVPSLACEPRIAEVPPMPDNRFGGMSSESHQHTRHVDCGLSNPDCSPHEQYTGIMDQDGDRGVSARRNECHRNRTHGLKLRDGAACSADRESADALNLRHGWDVVEQEGEPKGCVEEDHHGAIEDGDFDANGEDSDDDGNALSTLLIGDLTESWMQETYLDAIFTQLGERPVCCRVARDWQDGCRPSLGYAMVQLRSARAAHKLMVAFHSALPAMHPYRFMLRPAKSPCSVYVGSLDMPWLSSPVLRFIFAEEAIANTHLPHDDSGAHRGYGFVSFTTEAVAQRVIKTYHDTPLGRGRVHSMRWANANLVAPAVARQPAPSVDATAANEDNILESTRSVSHIDYVSTRPTSLPGSVLSPSMTPFLGSQTSVAMISSQPCALKSCADTLPRDEPPSALLARAQELHLQARSKTVHTTESRLEMASRAQRLLEGLINNLSPPAASPYRLGLLRRNDGDA